MARYAYVTQKAKGAPYVTSRIDAASAAELNLRLINLNRPVLHVAPLEKPKRKNREIRMPLRTKLTFIEQLETSAYLGMDFRTALTICLNTTSRRTKVSRRMASVIAELRDRVSRGSSFSQAIRFYPRIFDDVTIGLIAAGEEGGTLSEPLTNVRKIWARNDDLQHRLLMMLIYPVIVMMYTLSKIGSSAQFRRIHGRNPHCSDFNTNHKRETLENKRCITGLRTR
jgi:type II secretory pathway component PulF